MQSPMSGLSCSFPDPIIIIPLSWRHAEFRCLRSARLADDPWTGRRLRTSPTTEAAVIIS